MLTVHHLNDSRSQRILWLLEELEVPYEIKKYQRLPTLLAPPELLAVNPLGKAPVIVDGEVNLAESGAIIEYIMRKYGKGKLQPAEGTQAAIDDLYYLHYSEGTIMPLFVLRFICNAVPEQSPWFIRWLLSMVFNQLSAQFVDVEIKKNIDMIESHLSKKDWLAGGSEPTSADFSMSYAMEIIEKYKLGGPGGASHAYVKRMQARPAYKRALERGGEYTYALA
ncbi:thioredoxin-like protein [Rhodocollybia butyracea]|uniref:glutathione transferase n=1 Tax=Rhodocollybia butyracea TaxID=206335 RepID=A0A9P5PSZ1_9AGAR|nr:thioredoxin-like protein [Rhodocollybia butyracea]